MNNKKIIPTRNIAKAIKELRKERGMTQGDLAFKLKISPSEVSNWESGKRTPNPRDREQLCDIFDIDVNYLYGFSDIQNTALIDSSNSISINLYDRKCLNKTRKEDDIFDINKKISTMVLPRNFFNLKKKHFAIYSDNNFLLNYGIHIDDILIFVSVNKDEIQNNKIVCAYKSGKILVKKYENINSHKYNLVDSDETLEIKDSDNVVIIGQLVSLFTNF